MSVHLLLEVFSRSAFRWVFCFQFILFFCNLPRFLPESQKISEHFGKNGEKVLKSWKYSSRALVAFCLFLTFLAFLEAAMQKRQQQCGNMCKNYAKKPFGVEITVQTHLRKKNRTRSKSVQKAFKNRSKTVRNRSGLRKVLRKISLEGAAVLEPVKHP